MSLMQTSWEQLKPGRPSRALWLRLGRLMISITRDHRSPRAEHSVAWAKSGWGNWSLYRCRLPAWCF